MRDSKLPRRQYTDEFSGGAIRLAESPGKQPVASYELVGLGSTSAEEGGLHCSCPAMMKFESSKVGQFAVAIRDTKKQEQNTRCRRQSEFSTKAEASVPDKISDPMTRIDPGGADEHAGKLLPRAMLGRTFHDCPSDVLDRLHSAGILRSYAAGEYVVRRGTHTTNFLLVVSGEMESSATHVSGHRHLFGFLRQGDCTGIMSLMDGGEHIIDHIARVPTTILGIPNDAIMREMQDQPQLCLGLLRQLASRARITYSRVTLDPGVPLPIRLAWALQMMASLYGLPRGDQIVLDVKLSQGDIADSLGVSRQHLNPHLKQLEKDGVICLGRSSVTILNLDRLAKLAAR